MPFFRKKGGKNKKANRLCSYEDVIEGELPLLHNLIYNFAKTAKIKSCIAKIDNINEKDSCGRSALHIAAATSNAKALVILMECKLPIDVDAKDNDGKTALFKAVEVFSPECVLMLVEHGASTDIVDKNHSTPLHLATVNKKPSVIAIICNSNGDINVKDGMGYSPLHVAAAFGYLDIAKLLIEYGANINSRDNHGRTPLMAASCEGTPKMVRLLLEYGGDPLLKDNYDRTAADYSLQNQSESMSKILIEAIGQREYLTQTSTDDNRDKHDQDVSIKHKKLTRTDSMQRPESKNQNDLIEESSDIMEDTVRETINKVQVNELEQGIEMIENIHAAPVPSTNKVINEEGFPPAHDKFDDEVDFKTKRDTGLTESKVKREGYETAFDDSLTAQSGGESEDAKSDMELCNKRTRSANLARLEDTEKENLIFQLRIRNKQLRESNASLRKKLSEILKQSASEREYHQHQLSYEKARLQYLNLRNQHILEDKIKECFALESKLYQSYETLLDEIQKTKDGHDLDRISKDIIRSMRKKMNASDAKIGLLKTQLNCSHEEKSLLETEVESLRGEVIVLKEIIAKKKREQQHFDEISKNSDNNHNSNNKFTKFYEEELEKRVNDNEVLLNSVNKLRQENAMLKEQHISDRQEAIMLNTDLNSARDLIFSLQLQLENLKSGGREGMKGTSGNGIGRANSDSTVHGLRNLDSSSDLSINLKLDSSNIMSRG